MSGSEADGEAAQTHLDLSMPTDVAPNLDLATPISSSDPAIITIQGLNSTAAGNFSIGDIAVSSESGAESSLPASTAFSFVDNGGGEFMVVTSDPSSMAMNDSVSFTDGQTITFNLDEAGQLLLQSASGGEMADTSLLGQQYIQVERGDGIMEAQPVPLEVLQALQGELGFQLPPLETGFAASEPSHQEGEESEAVKMEIKAELPLQQADLGQTGEELSIQEEEDCGSKELEVSKQNKRNETVESAGAEEDEADIEGDAAEQVSDPPSKEDADDFSWTPNNPKIGKNVKTKIKKTQAKEVTAEAKKVAEEVPDLSSPIPLTDQTVVTINGKKCVLAFSQEAQQVCAYPIKPPPGTKRRGRPRLTEEQKAQIAEKKKQQQMLKTHEANSGEAAATSDQSTAAETLLELSNVGSDGIRRSSRMRKKAKLFEDYEELEDSGGEDGEEFQDNPEKDPDISLSLPDFRRKQFRREDVLVTDIATPPVKRGRGRPRRYPPPNQQQTPTSIPAVIIPSANGQTLVMTPIQGLQNLQNFRRQLPNLVPKPTGDAVSSASQDSNLIGLPSDSESMPLDTSGALDSNSIIPSALQGDAIPLVDEGDNAGTSDAADALDNAANVLDYPLTNSVSEKPKEDSGTDNPAQATVIQIPDSLLPLLGIKRDPVKIGLKASERELEKLKCPKCDFQGYYSQQYRNHIATHGEDIHKCKCCSYVSLDADELLTHFKESHPRCICPECDFMAEHAYIIKRHMMRHNAKSCTCKICGKVYKDLYILKMHVKMVHMPAEVLFECNVCTKKFTRKAHLKRHLRIHEPEKPFKCPHCDYRGCERSDITKHMLIHEEPKHACERCGKTFRHIKNKELHVKRHYGQRDYKCGVCDFFGYTFTDIRKHIERKHQDMKPLICDKCNKHFRSEAALKEHQQTCNVMMIEQVLAIPTSAGGTNQATIQIPTNIGPNGQIILDSGQTIAVNGQTLSVDKHGGVNIMVTEQQLGLPGGVTEEEEEEEEEEEMEDEEGGISQAMHIIGETIMTESGEEMHIISQEALGDSTQIISSSGLQDIVQAHSGTLPGHTVQIVDSAGQIMDSSGQLVDNDSQMVDSSDQIVGSSSSQLVDTEGQIVTSSGHLLDQSGQLLEDESGQLVEDIPQVSSVSRPQLTSTSSVFQNTQELSCESRRLGMKTEVSEDNSNQSQDTGSSEPSTQAEGENKSSEDSVVDGQGEIIKQEIL